MRRAHGNDGRASVTNTLDTINAAASAIASAHTHNRTSHHPLEKRWRSWLNISGCFGYHNKNARRVGDAVFVPETTTAGANPSAPVSSTQIAPSITLPFIAPPSSPASFFQSEHSSTAQSPVGIFSVTSVSASMYSPSNPASIFAIGPYANETQLVSPPIFSASSTAPFTPPPESVHLTTPSSPEVPFAHLLDPNNNRNGGETYQRFQISHYDFQSYQFHPGSPVGPLISPRSAISASGSSSPFLDSEFHAGDFRTTEPVKLISLDKLSSAYEKQNQKSNQGSGSLTPDAGFLPKHWVSEIKMSPRPSNNRASEISLNHRVSFELSAQKVLRTVENKQAASSWSKVVPKLKNDAATEDKEENARETEGNDKQVVAETPNGDDAKAHKRNESITLSSSFAREFNFDNAEGGDSNAPHIVVADWWANEKVAGKEGAESSKSWSFFPMIQSGVN
ncbi:uncharacterized protein LOC130711587 isoform X2 [Lotus japonicus]|uniref:uncharacterized protein LOC130711587 isoform X2 n=1 Tax=Lotus japonicus TaxID=34305 RepID=UPI00258C465E|nr:uncharacterized protein LOC130711587 isoform X2 [Lotus japonicus]